MEPFNWLERVCKLYHSYLEYNKLNNFIKKTFVAMVSYQRQNRRGLTSIGTIIYICHSFLGQETLVLFHITVSELTFAHFLRSTFFVINASTGCPKRMP